MSHDKFTLDQLRIDRGAHPPQQGRGWLLAILLAVLALLGGAAWWFTRDNVHLRPHFDVRTDFFVHLRVELLRSNWMMYSLPSLAFETGHRSTGCVASRYPARRPQRGGGIFLLCDGIGG